MTYQGMTDNEGNATLVIEQPQGVGLLTPLSVLPVNSLITTPVNRSVKFTVPTSPDTPEAQMWGHMADTLTVGDMEFQRPKLAAEATAATRTQEQDNETWARVSHADALNNPNAGAARPAICRAPISLPHCMPPATAIKSTQYPAGRRRMTTGLPPSPAPLHGRRYHWLRAAIPLPAMRRTT